MVCALLIICTAIVTAWAALIVQSLAGGGDLEPYFATILDDHAKPDDDDVIVLDAPFIFVDSNGERHEAERGMESDGASVGFLLPWPIVGWLTRIALRGTQFTGPFKPAAIAHDGIYARAKDSKWFRALISMQRAVGDRVIFEAARCELYRLPDGRTFTRKPAQWWRAFVVCALLRVAGFKAWMDDSSKAQRSLAALTSRPPA